MLLLKVVGLASESLLIKIFFLTATLQITGGFAV